MADPTTPKQSHVALYLCFALIAWLGYKLHTEEQRTTPERQEPLPTFESRIEPLREDATDWDAGYFFLVGNHPERQQQQSYAQPAVYTPQQQQPRGSGVYDPSRPPKPIPQDENLRIMQDANRQWDEYLRKQQRQPQPW